MFYQLVTCVLLKYVSFQSIQWLTGLCLLNRLLTTEIVMQFAFSRSAGLLEEHHDDFGSNFTDALAVGSHSVYIMFEKPWIRHLANAMPTSIMRFLKPEMGALMDMIEVRRPWLDPIRPFRNRSAYQYTQSTLETNLA